MVQYNVTGMSCAACSARVEKAVSKVPGVSNVSVSLLTNSMGVEGTASENEIIKAVTDAGYGASLKGSPASSGHSPSASDADDLEDKETPKMVKRLLSSVCVLIPLMYLSMGHMMWGWPLPGFLDGNHVAMALTEMLLAEIIMLINRKFFINGFKGIIHLAPNMDTLVAMGSGVSFLWSLYSLYAMTICQVNGDSAGVASYMHNLYFESAAMILTLITIGKTLESYSKGRTTDALKSLMKLAPQTAVILRDGQEVEVPISEVTTGDLFIVRPGDSIPVDGIVVEGESAINESALTGESIPVDKSAGDSVSAATANTSGYLKCQASRVGEDTTFSQIIRMVSDAAATKAPAARLADKVSGIFVPAVIGIAIITIAIWLIFGGTVGFALARGISVLVISCPCALGLATPVAIMVGNGMGARNGILFKTAAALEEAGKIDIAVLDKTGTVTAGEPVVTDVIPAEGFTADELLLKAASLESKSEHPLSKAILAAAQDKKLQLFDTENFEVVSGKGLKALCNGAKLTGGNAGFIGEAIGTGDAGTPGEISQVAEELAAAGKTPMYFACDNAFMGIIAVADVIKPDSAEAIRQLQGMGIRVVMLTGDNERTAKAIAADAGITDVIAGVLPEGKEKEISRLKKVGSNGRVCHVCMIGDGINDAPALTRADTGMAIGAGTDVAIDAADAVLVKSNLLDAAAAVRLSRATLRNIRENLFWAFIYNVICIPVAAGVWYPLFGLELSPMLGAAAMSLSSFCVCMNALRLNLFNIRSTKRDKARRSSAGSVTGIDAASNPETGGDSSALQKTIQVEGMMCHHCERHVKEALENLNGIEQATADFEKGTVVLELSGKVSDKAIKKAVKDAGYSMK